ncbi:MAG: dTDP-4-dehydrorhamnose 3,5-epimerase [Lentisphaeria bacterium]|nr:dTDP-4-dehydrorhamnose 3,5-epimerase [Lentisphaeria bacterium]
MKLIATDFRGAWLIEPKVFRDRRGWFLESWNREAFEAAGIDTTFVQDNHSHSCRHTLRGMHFQIPPRAQAKLVRCTLGSIWDVIVDIRHGSPTYGRWQGHELSSESHFMLYVPAGFAHGFCVLSEAAEVQYKCSDFYAPEAARGIRWDDPDLDIAWPIRDPVLSDADRGHPCLRDLSPFFSV